MEFLLGFICNLFPVPGINSMCKNIINIGFSDILTFLELELPSKFVCTVTKACNYTYPPLETKCNLCNFTVNLIESFGTISVSLVEKALDYVCDVLKIGSTEHNNCVIFIN